MPRRRDAPTRINWTPEEDAAVLEMYVDLARLYGAGEAQRRTARELYTRGLSRRQRSPGAVARRAAELGLRANRKIGKTREEKRAAILGLVRELRGLPVSYDDFEDELSIARRDARDVLVPLLEDGTIERIYDEDKRPLYRDPVAWREAAA